MLRTALIAGALAIFAIPASANPVQLAHAAGVEPGMYSTIQLIKLIELQQENGNKTVINRILSNPEGGALVPRLSTTHVQSSR